MRSALMVLSLVIAHCSFAADNGCSFGNGTATRQVAGFQIRIAPHRYKEDVAFPQCLAVIRDKAGKTIFSEHDAGFAVALAGEDMNGDGAPDVVLEGYSGGAHCCWTYFIISLGQPPGLLKTLENQLPVKFVRNQKTGRIEMSTADGAFDYFDGACHPCSPFPQVFLRLDGQNLVDISAEHLADYDETIGRNQKALAPADLERVRALKENPSDAEGLGLIVPKALTIVVAYLYSGREAQAHQALQEMWPPFDQERIWELILETRKSGILSYIHRANH